jgi:hypothetical protein
MNETITISLRTIAEAMATSYKCNLKEDHPIACAAYKAIMSEEDYNAAVAMAKEIIKGDAIKSATE